jgi:hypothetical protein
MHLLLIYDTNINIIFHKSKYKYIILSTFYIESQNASRQEFTHIDIFVFLCNYSGSLIPSCIICFLSLSP